MPNPVCCPSRTSTLTGFSRSILIDRRGSGASDPVPGGSDAGEIELVSDVVQGVAVHIGARVAVLARSGADHGEHELKGGPDRWRLYRVVG